MSIQFEDLSVPDLKTKLKKFYSEVRNTDGKLYVKNTFVGICAPINRYLRSPPHYKNFNILTDSDFHFSNQMFNSILKNIQADKAYESKPRMYAIGMRDCPVVAFKKYIEQRNPATPHFVQQPRPRVNENHGVWYTSRPVNEKTLKYIYEENF